MPRFVILEHDHPALHWDFMLEADGVLKTWRLPAPPPTSTDDAVPLGDHRRAYLDYEGPVSGGRGVVRRWDAGEYETMGRDEDGWTVVLHGQRWQGRAILEAGPDGRWRITFE